MSWTWIIYLATHNDVAFAGEQSIARMRAAAGQAGLQLLVQQDSAERSVRRVLGAEPEVLADLGQLDSGDPQTLIDCVAWAAQHAPAEQYALVIWSHGSGWEPTDLIRLAKQQQTAVPPTLSELTERSQQTDLPRTFFSSSLRRMLEQPTPAERAIAFDDGSGQALDTIELGNVVTSATRSLGRPLDLLIMNACQMGSVEVAYQLRQGARIYLATQDDMPVESLPYDTILPALAQTPQLPAPELGRLIVDHYQRYFQTAGINWGQSGLPPGATLGAFDLAAIESLSQATHTLASAMCADIYGQIDAIYSSHRQAHAFKFRQFDLASFCRNLSAHADSSAATRQAATQVLAALEQPGLRLAFKYTAAAYAHTGGLSTYLLPPQPGKTISQYYAETAYDQATGWGKFLTEYLAAAA